MTADNAETSDEALKAKIRKVMALLEGAKTEGEAQAASLALQRLLAKSGLAVEDVIAEQNDGTNVVETECKTGDSSSNWKVDLASVIAGNYRCKLYMKTCGKTKSVVFVGLSEDADIAAGCFYATVKAAQRCFRAYCRRAREETLLIDTTRAAFKNGYYLGFVSGLSRAYEEQVASSNELAICLQTPSIVKAHMDAKTLSRGRRRRTVVYDASYDAGKGDGYGFGRGNRLER